MPCLRHSQHTHRVRRHDHALAGSGRLLTQTTTLTGETAPCARAQVPHQPALRSTNTLHTLRFVIPHNFHSVQVQAIHKQFTSCFICQGAGNQATEGALLHSTQYNT